MDETPFGESVSNFNLSMMTQHEKLQVRMVNCGGFEFRLIDAWFHADGNNKRILEEAFKNTNFDLK